MMERNKSIQGVENIRFMHFIRDNNHGVNFINFVNNNFKLNEHRFIIIDKCEQKYKGILKADNIVFLDNPFDILKNKKLMNYLIICEKIYIHFLSFEEVKFFLIKQKLIAKCNWVIWGGDLYFHECVNKSFKFCIKEYMRKQVIKSLKQITYLVEGDYELAVKWYKTKAIALRGFYPVNISIEEMYKIKQIAIKTKNKIKILIGNSAHSSNEHKDMIDLLYKYRNENLIVYCPLSYGNKEYGKKIYEYGKLKLGKKFVALFKFMDVRDYLLFLNNMDIAMFNQKRQQGLGNAYPLLFFGKKVFMREDVSTWNELTNYYKVKIFNINEVKHLSFKEYINMSYEFSQKNCNSMSKIYEKAYAKQIWDYNFNV